MSIKRALFYGFTIAFILLIAVWLIGHLWVFVMLVGSAFVGIAVNTKSEREKADSHNSDDESAL